VCALSFLPYMNVCVHTYICKHLHSQPSNQPHHPRVVCVCPKFSPIYACMCTYVMYICTYFHSQPSNQPHHPRVVCVCPKFSPVYMYTPSLTAQQSAASSKSLSCFSNDPLICRGLLSSVGDARLDPLQKKRKRTM